MVFSSTLFLFRFLPIAMTIYFLTPKKFKNLTIFILSLFFYSWGEVKYFPIMIISVIVDYCAGQGIKHFGHKKLYRRLFLTMSLVVNLGMLFFFKYSNFFITNINALTGLAIPTISLALPLGISFYTFQTLTYTIDVYFNKVEPEDNIINFAAFVTLFPQLIAGPIVKYTDINRELQDRKVDLAQIEDGVKTFIYGLGKKVLIANNLGLLWDEAVAIGFENLSTPMAWLSIAGFGLQIFFDFSGYSTMAIGLGKMLGFNFPQNFNYPYISKSVTEFWRRWHITLGSFFREYLYIPLGGNRKGALRTYINLFVVWFATGFWHGADWNFIFWGLFFFVFIVIEKAFLLKYLEKSKVLSRIYLLGLVLVSWAIFQITDLGQLGIYISRMFAFDFGTDWLYYLRNYGVILIVGIIFSIPLIPNLYKKIEHIKIVPIITCTIILAASIAYLVDASYNPFLYFRF